VVEQQPSGLVWTIEVAAGSNRGAALSLAPGRYSVGAGPGDDIVLADTAIAEEQVSLEIDEDGAAVTALSPGASLRRSRLGTGQRRPLRPGMELHLGQTRLRFDGPPPPPASFGKGRIALLAALVFVGAAASAGGYHVANPAPKAAYPAPAAPAPVPAATAEQAAGQLSNHLREAGLGDAIRTSASGGAVLAEGAILPGDAARWTAAQRWFDGQFGSSVALVAAVGKADRAAQPILDVAAVALTPVPHVITRSGERYMLGSVLPGGWAVTAITADRITLRNGSREVGITL